MSEFAITVHFDRKNMDDSEQTARDFVKDVFSDHFDAVVDIKHVHTHDVSAEHTTELTVGLEEFVNEQDVRNAFFDSRYETDVVKKH